MRFPAFWLLLFTAGDLSGAPDQAVLDKYCVGCHNAQTRTSGLELDALSKAPVGAHPEAWEKVVRRLRARYMPPAGLPRPDEKSYQALVSSLEAQLDRAAAAKLNPGRPESFRRLNCTEYKNSIRDLLSLDVDVSALLPSDEVSHGFDNVSVGDLSPTLLERYLNAARKISRLAVGLPSRSPGGVTVNLPPDLTQEEHFEDLPLGTRGGMVLQHTFPLDAQYEIQLRLARDRNEMVEGLTGPHQVELMLDGERVKLFTVNRPSKGDDHSVVDRDLKVKLFVKAGPHAIAVAFPKQPSYLLETERQPYQAHFNMDRHPRIRPAVYSVSVNGPFDAQGPGETPSRRRIFACRPSTPAEEEPCAKRILTSLMRRAYRRPVTAADLEVPLKFYRQSKPFEAGVEMALRSVLVSPEFLFRVEQDPAGVAPKTAYKLSNLELATRLSFFLWSSIPDDELLDTAIAGKLTDPAVLTKQTRRLLADPRSRVLTTNFAEQWLYLRNLNNIAPDMRVFPDFDDNLRQAFRQETELFFESIMREDRGVIDLLRANYTFVNERLAKHYGLPNIYGSHFRRVTFDNNAVRGGLLRQGAILMVTSYATRTSPVIRGKWILENLLGVTPPPPPAAVPALKEKHDDGKLLTMRERLAQHRDNPACSSCHKLMDPVGFSLENYDAVGRWRTVDAAAPIDSAGGLPDGSKFNGVTGLEQAILARPEIFAGTFAEKLLTYALGRGIEVSDAPAVRQIVRQSQPQGYKFSSIVLEIVQSAPFQMRRSL
ncbi:MAG: DUF1592 domain-containing protein [Bryobacteraceae bacterium]|nr:DUF1592 domain-containing protein [Bryobacteraceae bacterium]